MIIGARNGRVLHRKQVFVVSLLEKGYIMAKRFENKSTVVKGFVIDKRNGQATPFEAVTAYVRATEKAAKMIDLVSLGFDASEIDNYIVVASECINEKSEPVRYSNSKLIDFATAILETKEMAEEQFNLGAFGSDYSIREVKFYEFECGAFLRETVEEATSKDYAVYSYDARTIVDQTPLNLTKVDAREFMRDSAERYTGKKCLYVADMQKHELTRFAILSDDALAKCVIEKSEK